MERFCSDVCPFLSITEDEQENNAKKTGKKLEHFCNKYSVRVYHLIFHPLIVTCDKCDRRADK